MSFLVVYRYIILYLNYSSVWFHRLPHGFFWHWEKKFTGKVIFTRNSGLKPVNSDFTIDEGFVVESTFLILINTFFWGSTFQRIKCDSISSLHPHHTFELPTFLRRETFGSCTNSYERVLLHKAARVSLRELFFRTTETLEWRMEKVLLL